MARRRRSSPFLDSLRQAIRVRRYSIRTEEAYVGWAKRFILYHDKRHPVDMAEAEVAAFLSHLAVDLAVAPATQNQAMNALSFFSIVPVSGSWSACVCVSRMSLFDTRLCSFATQKAVKTES
jgi:hypothetical protein